MSQPSGGFLLGIPGNLINIQPSVLHFSQESGSQTHKNYSQTKISPPDEFQCPESPLIAPSFRKEAGQIQLRLLDRCGNRGVGKGR
jgi:hypothetical protein